MNMHKKVISADSDTTDNNSSTVVEALIDHPVLTALTSACIALVLGYALYIERELE